MTSLAFLVSTPLFDDRGTQALQWLGQEKAWHKTARDETLFLETNSHPGFPSTPVPSHNDEFDKHTLRRGATELTNHALECSSSDT